MGKIIPIDRDRHILHFYYRIGMGCDDRDDSGKPHDAIKFLDELSTNFSSYTSLLSRHLKRIIDPCTRVTASLENLAVHFAISTDTDRKLEDKLRYLFHNIKQLPTIHIGQRSKPESLAICQRVLREFGTTMSKTSIGDPEKYNPEIYEEDEL